VQRLGEDREGQRGGETAGVAGGCRDEECRRPHAAGCKDLLRPRLVEAERQREWIAARIGDAVELADRRDVRLTVGTVASLGDVEHDVRPGRAQPFGELLVRLEPDHLAVRPERTLHGGDGFRAVPLGELVVRSRV
jgi:hypothetical protein